MKRMRFMNFIIIIIISILIVGCNIDFNNTIQKNIPITKINVYSNENYTNAKVISIYNPNGDVKISESKNNKMIVNVNFIKTKEIKDFDEKLKNLTIKPKNYKNIVFFEPLYSGDFDVNYWNWIYKSFNADGIQIDFEVEIPKSIQEIRVYSEIGNILINDITGKIHAQTNIGNILAKNITPIDEGIFFSNISKRKNGIEISFKTLNRANDIKLGSSLGGILVRIPNDQGYKYYENDSLKYFYENEMYSEKQFRYCKGECVKNFRRISDKNRKVQITANKSEIFNEIKIQKN